MQNGKGTFSCGFSGPTMRRLQKETKARGCLGPREEALLNVYYAILFHNNDQGRHKSVSKNVFGFCGCHLQAFANLARFLVICCDGVWDVKTNQQALENVGMNMQRLLWVFPAKWSKNANVNSIQVSIYAVYIFQHILAL